MENINPCCKTCASSCRSGDGLYCCRWAKTVDPEECCMVHTPTPEKECEPHEK